MLSKTLKYIACRSQRLTKPLLQISLYSIVHCRHIHYLRRIPFTIRCIHHKSNHHLTGGQIFKFSQRYRSQNAIFSNKIKNNPKDALLEGGIKDNVTILSGGFGICGIPMTLSSNKQSFFPSNPVRYNFLF